MSGHCADWAEWLARWDRQQQRLLPDREEWFAAMFDVVEAVAGAPRRVLDLASGPGSITVRLLRRFPDGEATLVDVDPALLAIASGVLGGDERVTIVRADLADPGRRAQPEVRWTDPPTGVRAATRLAYRGAAGGRLQRGGLRVAARCRGHRGGTALSRHPTKPAPR